MARGATILRLAALALLLALSARSRSALPRCLRR